jgi:hypothetical protein
VAGDLACIVDIERHETRLDGRPDPATFQYRTTHLLRRETGGWSVVPRYADPLATFRGPEVVHGPTPLRSPWREDE